MTQSIVQTDLEKFWECSIPDLRLIKLTSQKGYGLIGSQINASYQFKENDLFISNQSTPIDNYLGSIGLIMIQPGIYYAIIHFYRFPHYLRTSFHLLTHKSFDERTEDLNWYLVGDIRDYNRSVPAGITELPLNTQFNQDQIIKMIYPSLEFRVTTPGYDIMFKKLLIYMTKLGINYNIQSKRPDAKNPFDNN